MMCNSDSGIGIGIGFQGFSGVAELESELNWRLKSLEGIGIGIELEAKPTRRNWNRNGIETLWNWNRNWSIPASDVR